jgi:hypothetical protein
VDLDPVGIPATAVRVAKVNAQQRVSIVRGAASIASLVRLLVFTVVFSAIVLLSHPLTGAGGPHGRRLRSDRDRAEHKDARREVGTIRFPVNEGVDQIDYFQAMPHLAPSVVHLP